MSKIGIILCFLVHSVLSAPFSDNLIIELPDGQVQGTTYATKNNKTYFGFQGIPYASPPIGSLRFEAPQPPKSWDGIWDATKDSKSCLSAEYASYPDTESEDCLYINVYTPDLQPSDKLPVMFWIYGGAFTSGNSSKWLYGPDFLVEEDVIVVSFNYRLAPFGFLSTGDKAIRGNAGLKDQNLALKWTRDNIAFFGGDPEKVTIFGQSAGATSTALHLISKKSTGLFRAAIVESGSALVPWSIVQEPTAYAFALADALSDDHINDTQELKEFLQEKSGTEIITAALSLSSAGLQLGPVIEFDDEDAFLTESPYQLLESGDFNQVPIIIGICSEESLMMLQDLETAKYIALTFDLSSSSVLPADLQPNSSVENEAIKQIKDIYLKEGETFSSNLVALAKLFTDTGFSRGVIKHAQLSSNYVNVYLYQFAYYGRPLTKAFIDGAEKAGHSAELAFLFNFGPTGDSTDPDDVLTQNRMTYLWANFAKYMNPTPPVPKESKLQDYLQWPTITPTNLQYLNINGTLEVRPYLKETTFPLWDQIYQTYGRKPFITY